MDPSEYCIKTTDPLLWKMKTHTPFLHKSSRSLKCTWTTMDSNEQNTIKIGHERLLWMLWAIQQATDPIGTTFTDLLIFFLFPKAAHI